MERFAPHIDPNSGSYHLWQIAVELLPLSFTGDIYILARIAIQSQAEKTVLCGNSIAFSLDSFCSPRSAGFFPAVYLIAVKPKRAQLDLGRFPCLRPPLRPYKIIRVYSRPRLPWFYQGSRKKIPPLPIREIRGIRGEIYSLNSRFICVHPGLARVIRGFHVLLLASRFMKLFRSFSVYCVWR